MSSPPDARNTISERDAQSLADLLGRLVLTHRIDTAAVASALHVSAGDVVALTDGRPVPLGTSARLSLVVNIILRLEIRLAGDSRAIRAALATPLASLGGASPADLMTGSLDQLRRVRGAIDHVAHLEERWWRVGHN